MTSFEDCSLAIPQQQTARAEINVADLVAEHSALLFRVAHSVLRSRSDAEDVVQDAFVRVLEHRGRLSEIRDMRVWLVRIAWNLALDRRRRVRPDQMDAIFVQTLVGNDLPVDERLAEARQMEIVLKEMERLPRSERHVLLLSTMEELQIAEIAAVVGRSASAVRALLYRARTRLRQRIGGGQ